MPWELSGNTFGTTTTNFLGTRDAQPLVIKTNGAEAMRVGQDGKVSIGNLGSPRSPDYKLDVQGILNADDIYKDGVPLVESQWTTIGGGITYEGGEVGIGTRVSGYRLNVEGAINATDIHKGGTPLVGSQWEEASGGISYSGGSVGIGVLNASYKLNVAGSINATEFRRNGNVLVGSQWTDVSGVGIRYNALVGLGKAPASPYKLDVAGSINATDIHKGGTPLVGSQWEEASGGISYSSGSVGIGVLNASYKLNVAGSINATDIHKDGSSLVSSQWTDVAGGINYATGNVGIGSTTAPVTALQIPERGLQIGFSSTVSDNFHFTSDTVGDTRGLRIWNGNYGSGSHIMTALPNGNVGIGTEKPNKKLHVHLGRMRVSESDGTQSSGVLELANATKTNYVFTDGASGHLHARTDSGANHVLLQAGGTQQGNVGIGIANPQAKLHISSGEPQFRLESTGDRALVQLAKGGAAQWDFGVGQRAGNNDFWFGDMVTYRMVLQKGTGNVGIGTLNPRQKLDVDGNIRWGNNWLQLDQGGSIELGGDNSTPGVGVPYIDFHFRGLTQDFNTRIINDDNGRLSIVGNLNVTGGATKPGGGWWAATSDIRLKKSVQSLKGALEKLLRLRGVSFEWKKPEEQGNLTGTQMGLVAQEVEEVFPEWISTDPDGYRILTIRGFEALAVEAFKQLKAENEELRARIEALEPA